MKKILDKLKALTDESYKNFQVKLMPTVDKALVLGVRTPALKTYAKELFGTEDGNSFLQELPHKYFEENQLHAFIISNIKDFDECIDAINKFLPYVDNWATCDQLTSKALKKNPEKLSAIIDNWLNSDHTYTVRFALKLCMNFYLDENFNQGYLDKAALIKSDEYYINMMIAWYFATALAKQYEAAIPYIENHRLPQWVHKKTIQKACESYRITPEQKQYLKTFR